MLIVSLLAMKEKEVNFIKKLHHKLQTIGFDDVW